MAPTVIGCAEDVVPKTSGYAEVHLGKGVVNFVMHSKFAIPMLGEIEVVMNVMEHAIKEKPSRKSSEETENIGDFKIDAEDEPVHQ